MNGMSKKLQKKIVMIAGLLRLFQYLLTKEIQFNEKTSVYISTLNNFINITLVSIILILVLITFYLTLSYITGTFLSNSNISFLKFY